MIYAGTSGYSYKEWKGVFYPEKLAAKDLDLVVVNDSTEPGAGFAVDTNRVTIVHRDGRTEPLGLMPKSEVADAILDRVEALLRER